jgi:hypothetical protein
MHVIGFVLSVATLAAVWYWRLRVLREAGMQLFDFAGRVRGARRRHNFKRRAESSVLDTVDDPALAAAIFLFALARQENPRADVGQLVRAQIARIPLDARRLDEYLTYAEWAARDLRDPSKCARKFRALWHDRLTEDERALLSSMSWAVVGASPQPSQRSSIRALQAELA